MSRARILRLEARARERARARIPRRLHLLTDEDLADLWRPPGHPDTGSRLDRDAMWQILGRVGISYDLISFAVGERDGLPGELRERWLDEIFQVLKAIGEERHAGIRAAAKRIKQREDEEGGR